MKILSLVLFILEETIIATSSLGPVTLLEVKWAREMGLLSSKTSLEEAARQITASRLVVRRYGVLVKIPPEIKDEARRLGIDPGFARDLAEKLLSLKKFVRDRFGSEGENYEKWRDRELEREEFRFLFRTSPPSKSPTCGEECSRSSGAGR